MKASFGLGLAALGRPGYINLGHSEDLQNKYSIGGMRQRAHEMLDCAWESGVRYFDAARSYGRAEEFLGTWLITRDINPEEVSIGSKWGYTYTAAWQVQTPEGVAHEVKRHELKVLQAQYMATMKQLDRHLNLYQIHSATIESGVLENQEVLDCLNGLRESGLKIGLSVSGPQQAETIEKALTIKFKNELLFGSIQATWNLLERCADRALQCAADAGVEVIVKEAVANGRLTDRNNAPEFAQQKKQLAEIASDLGTTIDALALSAAANQPWATVVLSGAATPDHLRSNLSGADVAWTSELDDRLQPLIEDPTAYWATRSELPWN